MNKSWAEADSFFKITSRGIRHVPHKGRLLWVLSMVYKRSSLSSLAPALVHNHASQKLEGSHNSVASSHLGSFKELE